MMNYKERLKTIKICGRIYKKLGKMKNVKNNFLMGLHMHLI